VGGFAAHDRARATENWQDRRSGTTNDFWHNIPASIRECSGIAALCCDRFDDENFVANTVRRGIRDAMRVARSNLIIKSGGIRLFMGRLTTTIANEFYGAPRRFCRRARKILLSAMKTYGFFLWAGPVVRTSCFISRAMKQQYIIGFIRCGHPAFRRLDLQAADLLTIPGKYGSYAPSRPSHCLVRHPPRRVWMAAAASWARAGFWPRNLIGGLAGTNNISSARCFHRVQATRNWESRLSDQRQTPLYVRFFGGQRQPDCSLTGKPCARHGQLNLKDYFEWRAAT